MQPELTISTTDEIARALCEHFTEGRPGETHLSEIARCGEASFLAHYLNGPGADLVMRSNYRWLSVCADDISQLATVADLFALCRRHVVSFNS